jgi:uncharacterized protein
VSLESWEYNALAMKTKFKKAGMIIVSFALIILGLVGLALPFLQGFLFLFTGIALLSLVSKRMRAWLEERTRPYPKTHKFVEKTQQWMIGIIGSTDD